MPANYQRVTFVWGGALPGGEVWQNGVTQRTDVAPTQAQLDEGANTAATALVTWWAALPVAFSAQGFTLLNVRSYYYPGGSGAAALVASKAIAAALHNNSQTAPNQCALVASLRSGTPGPKNQGRIYVPCPNPGSLTNGNVGTSTASGLASATAGLLSTLNAIDLYGAVVVGSNGAPVTTVRVDTILDTQRRRRNKLLPTASPSTAVDPPL